MKINDVQINKSLAFNASNGWKTVKVKHSLDHKLRACHDAVLFISKFFKRSPSICFLLLWNLIPIKAQFGFDNN